MKFARVNLTQTDYQEIDLNWGYLARPDWSDLKQIYNEYCRYKKFDSVMPLFDLQFNDSNTDVIGYCDQGEIVAFSIIKLWDKDSAECVQFAWNYNDPKLRLGIRTLEHECTIYKQRGFKYLYLGLDQEYKRQLQGYEILGALS